MELLPSIIEQISEDAVICIFHTHVANQIPEQVKRKLEKQIQEIGAKRDVFHLYNNMWDGTFILIIILTETNIVKRLEKQKDMGDGLVGSLGIDLYAKVNLIIMVLSPIFVIKQLMEDNPSTVFILLNL